MLLFSEMVKFLLVEITLFLSSLMGNAVVSAGGNAVASNCKLMLLNEELLTGVFLLAKRCFFLTAEIVYRYLFFCLWKGLCSFLQVETVDYLLFVFFVLMLLMLLVVS